MVILSEWCLMIVGRMIPNNAELGSQLFCDLRFTLVTNRCLIDPDRWERRCQSLHLAIPSIPCSHCKR